MLHHSPRRLLRKAASKLAAGPHCWRSFPPHPLCGGSFVTTTGQYRYSGRLLVWGRSRPIRFFVGTTFFGMILMKTWCIIHRIFTTTRNDDPSSSRGDYDDPLIFAMLTLVVRSSTEEGRGRNLAADALSTGRLAQARGNHNPSRLLPKDSRPPATS